MPRILESMGLLGDQGIEFLFGNDTVKIQIGSLDHLLESIVVS